MHLINLHKMQFKSITCMKGILANKNYTTVTIALSTMVYICTDMYIFRMFHKMEYTNHMIEFIKYILFIS